MTLLTEQEAKTKWCPFSRYQYISGDHAANRWKQSAPPEEPHALNPVPCRCIGSDCMAWRAELVAVNTATGRQLKSGDMYLASDPIEWRDGDRGYCGLAGKP